MKAKGKPPLAPIAKKPVASRRRLVPMRTRRTDREFLPAALEILETPPSPIKIGLLVAICAFFLSALVWAYFGRIDIIAIAQGKFQPTGRVKIIQPLETSRVVATKVENGETVRAGAVLVELDPSEAKADVAGLAADLASYSAEVLRRQASIHAAQSRNASTSLNVVWPASIPPAIRSREEQVYAADILSLNAQVGSLQAQADQKTAEAQRLTTMITAQDELIQTLQTRVTMRSDLIGTNAGSKANLLDSMAALQTQKTTQAQQKGQLGEAKANLEVYAKDIRRTYDAFIADNAQKLAEAERQVSDLAEKLRKAQSRLDHMVLRSPIDGVVQASTLTTVGQVVTSGQELMRIVPEGASLEIECYLPNRDIGFVKVGDEAVVKVESFPFTRYGTIDAVVTRVARDAIPEADAEQNERDPTHATQSLSQAGGQRMQNLVFPITLRPKKNFIDVDGNRVMLGAGMAVTAEIRTGSRRILEYVFSPLAKLGSEAMKER